MSNAKLEQIFIVLLNRVSDLYMFGYGQNEGTYLKIAYELIYIKEFLGFSDEEVEQAYLKKHEENYKRQREGY